MRLLLKFANNNQDAVLNFSITAARKASWANAVLLAYMNEQQQQAHIQEMDFTVKQIAQRIQSPGG